MKKTVIISTGGTFNKTYDPHKGELIIDCTSKAVKEIASKWLCQVEMVNIIGKDSLDITHHDRVELLTKIHQSKYNNIIIVHGTDTMDITAKYLAKEDIDKSIILTGAMVPYSLDPIEATANLASAFGYIQTITSSGVYIAMNGVFGRYDIVQKDREKGQFILL